MAATGIDDALGNPVKAAAAKHSASPSASTPASAKPALPGDPALPPTVLLAQRAVEMRIAAVDEDVLAGHVAGSRREQEHRHRGDLFGKSHALA